MSYLNFDYQKHLSSYLSNYEQQITQLLAADTHEFYFKCNNIPIYYLLQNTFWIHTQNTNFSQEVETNCFTCPALLCFSYFLIDRCKTFFRILSQRHNHDNRKNINTHVKTPRKYLNINLGNLWILYKPMNNNRNIITYKIKRISM